MKNNILFSMVFLILLTGMLAACSTSSRTSDLEINLVTPDATITPEFLERLQKKFPQYKITHIDPSKQGQSISELITTGIPVDIIGIASTGYIGAAINTKLAVDMSEQIKKYNINLGDFEPQLVQFVRDVSEGGIYAVPGGSAINHVLFYNKTIFDKFGVPYLRNGMIWEEVMDIAAKLTRKDGEDQYYGFTGHTGIMSAWNQLGIPYVDKATNKPTINTDPRWKQYFEIIYGNTVLNDALNANGLKFIGSTGQLLAGKHAMLLFNAGIATTNKDLLANTISWDMVALPSFKDVPKTGSPMNSTIWGITTQTRSVDAAMEIIQFMVSEEVMIELSKEGFLVPMIKDSVTKVFATAVQDPSKNWGSVNYNKFAAIPYKHPTDAQITTIYSKYIQSFVAGEYDLNTTLRMAAEEIQQLLTEHAKKQAP